jgi:triosephosphate isomerase (TIM)
LMDRFGRKDGNTVAILYGGSVNPINAQSILQVQHVNGALVGGASLKADSFLKIICAKQPDH